jgi:hypothetical protein
LRTPLPFLPRRFRRLQLTPRELPADAKAALTVITRPSTSFPPTPTTSSAALPSSTARDVVAERFGDEIARNLVLHNPEAVVRGRPLPYFLKTLKKI